MLMKPSSDLKTTMNIMDKLLRGELSSEELSKIWSKQNPKRLAIYQDFVFDHVKSLLEKNFSSVFSQLSQNNWEEICKKYFKSHGPKHWNLNSACDDFPDFLDHLSKNKDYGIKTFFPELALLELEELKVYFLDLKIATPSEIKCLTLNPSLSIINVEHSISQWMDCYRQGIENLSDPLMEAETLFIFRHPKNHLAYFYKVDNEFALAFNCAHQQKNCCNEISEMLGVSILETRKFLEKFEDLGLILIPNDFF